MSVNKPGKPAVAYWEKRDAGAVFHKKDSVALRRSENIFSG
jgi:hypothetical protein